MRLNVTDAFWTWTLRTLGNNKVLTVGPRLRGSYGPHLPQY